MEPDDISGPDEIERDGTGMYQYVDGGKRYLPGEWPTDPTKAFETDGAVSIYADGAAVRAGAGLPVTVGPTG